MELISENNYKKDEGGITLRDIVEMVLANWYWFVLSVLLCVGGVYLYLATLSPVYQRQAVMLIKVENKSNTDLTALLELNGGISGSGVDNELYILQTRQLIREVVERLNLDVTYQIKNRLRTTHLYQESPVAVTFIDPYLAPVALEIIPVDDRKYRLNSLEKNGSKEAIGQEVAYGDTLNTSAGRISVSLTPWNLAAYTGKSITVSRMSLPTATAVYHAKVSTALARERTTLVQITCTDTNTSRAEAILNTLFDVYNETIIEDKNRIATNTARFIDERIQIISKELGEVENELTDFKQQNRIVSVDANASLYLSENSRVKEEILQLKTELSVAQSIKSYLIDATRNNQLIPNISGVGDASVQSQITSYNELLLQRDRLISNSGENNPVVLDMNKNLSAMRGTISGSMDNYMSTLRLRLKTVQAQETQLLSSIRDVPLQEKMALNISRQQSIKETLYTFLLNKREENALQLAVTEANVRTVEAPFGSNAPIAPARSSYLMAAFIIGLLLPLGIQVLAFFWDMTVRGRKDVEAYTNLPVLGEIPARRKTEIKNEIVVSEKKTDRITEAFRMMRANIDFIAPQAQVLMFTSTMAGEGKTFVSLNLAVTLAMSGKKVILIDSDLRKRTQTRLTGIKQKEGLSLYLSGKIADIPSIITQGAPHPLVDIILTGAVPPNPSELLMSPRMETLIAELRKQYDYILLDNVPALVVADASIVNRVADMTVYVIRDGVLDRRYLPELEKLHQEKKFRNMCVAINGSEMNKKYGYGYGKYGYGRYGYSRYGYAQYGEGYYEEDEK